MIKKTVIPVVLVFIIAFLVTADEYRAEPGDRLFIYVVNHGGYNQEVIIRADGKISYIGGDLEVQGLTPEEIARRIEDRLKRYIRKPVVFVSPLAKQNQVFVMGAVMAPNVYRFGATDRIELRQAIAMAGGMPESGADLSKVAVIRSNGQVERYNLTQLDNFKPVYVYPGETVIVPSMKYIEVKGNVQEPDKYQIKGEKVRVDHALAMAGGPLYDANLPNLVIYREDGERISLKLNDEFWTAELDEERYFLYSGDVLFVPNAFKTEQVKVLGAVRNAGSYRIRNAVDPMEAISLAGGTIRNVAELEKAVIIRKDKSIEKIDLSKYPQEQEVLLYPGDTLEIPEKFQINWSMVLSVLSLISSTVYLYMTVQQNSK